MMKNEDFVNGSGDISSLNNEYATHECTTIIKVIMLKYVSLFVAISSLWANCTLIIMKQVRPDASNAGITALNISIMAVTILFYFVMIWSQKYIEKHSA